MAQAKFKGTMAQVNKALADSGIIGKFTEVTITDNRYDAADLLALIAADGGLLQPIILERTSAYSELSDTEDNLITVLSGVKKYTGPVDVDGDAAAAKLNTIASLTTGKVTAELDSGIAISSTTVAALKDVKSSDNISFEPSATSLSGDDAIAALISLSKMLKDTDFSAIANINGTSSGVNAIKSALPLLPNDVNVTIDPAGQISAADVNALAKATKGAVKATIKDGAVKATLNALKDIDPTVDELTFKTNDKSVNAGDLIALDAKLDTFHVTAVETITENAKDIGVAAKNITDALAIANDANVTISGTLPATSAADIASIAAILATNGKVTATLAAGKAADLRTAIAGADATDALTLTLTDVTVAADDLNSLNALTAVPINANSVKTITGIVADVTTVYEKAAAKEISGLGNENVTITAAASAANINAVLKATSGIVSASVTAGKAADLFADLRDATAKDALYLSTSGGTDTAAELLALDNKTSIIVNASATTHTSGTAAELKKVFASSGIKVDGDLVITVTDTASAADVNAIAAKTTSAVTATIKDGSVAATLKALSDVTNTDIITFKTTDKSVKASDLVDLNTKLAGGSFDKSKIETITGTAAETGAVKAIPLALTALGVTTNAEVKITGNVPVANIKAILDATTGKVTATLEAGDAAAIKTALADTVVNNIAVTVNSATAADLVAILPLTSAKVKVDATEITGTFAEVNSVYTTNKSSFTALGNENVTISTTNSASDVNSIAKVTSGAVTATVASGTAKDLLAALKDTNGKDDLTITVGNTVADAKDLVALAGKTSKDLVITSVTDVNGTVAEVNKLIAAGIVTDPNYTLSGTVRAVDADDIAKATSGVVTATIAAGTAENLNSALRDSDEHAYTLTVNGATASAATLEALNTKTSKAITVEAKEVVGTLADLTLVFDTNADDYKGLGNKNIKVSGTVAVADIADLDAILATTSGVVTATVGAGNATDLIAGLTNATSGKDALTLVTDDTAATAAELLALDDATSVTVNAKAITANGISGNAADLKKLIASKGVELANNVGITASGTTNAADLGAILKATTGVVEATVLADTAAKLNSALKDANSADALTLSVNGTTVTAKDLLALGGKTSVAAITVNVSAITGNITEITDVFVTGGKFIASIGADDVTISGTVKASEADAIAEATTGTVTATIAAGNANVLNSTLVDSGGQVNAYKITVSGDNANASDLLGLDTKTSVTVNAAAIKNIAGDAEDVRDVYAANANKTISGLGNETVDLSSATDADVALINAINNFTTGLIKLDTITFETGAGAKEEVFNLKQLGDLKGITGLVAIDATNNEDDIINISIKDLLEANDSRDNIIFDITGEASSDKVTLSDYSGWTVANATADQAQYVFTNSTTEQTITINLTAITDTTVL